MKILLFFVLLSIGYTYAQTDTLLFNKYYRFNFDDVTIDIMRTSTFVKILNNSSKDLDYLITMTGFEKHQNYGTINKGTQKESFDNDFVINRQKNITNNDIKSFYPPFDGKASIQRCFIRIKQKKYIICKCQVLDKNDQKLIDKKIQHYIKD